MNVLQTRAAMTHFNSTRSSTRFTRQRVDWFTAVNRCRSNNASLAVFDDDVRQNFPSSLLSDNVKAWIGLMKSWWTWPGLLLLLFIIIIYNIFGCIVGES